MATSLWNSAPPKNGAQRDQWILDQIQQGNYALKYAPLTLTDKAGNTLEMQVMTDALKVGGVRINVSARLAQKIAWMLGLMLPTAKISDTIWANRQIALKPMPRPITSDTSAMVDQSSKIDKAIGISDTDVPDTIVGTVGKDWVLTNKLVENKGGVLSPKIEPTTKEPVAANYGWHFVGQTFDGKSWEPTVSLPGSRLIQGVGTKHGYSHSDYSQNFRAVARKAMLNGQEVDLAWLVKDPTYASLISSEGPLLIDAQPGVTNDHPDSPSGTVPDGGEEGGSSGGSSTAGQVLRATAATGFFVGLLAGLETLRRRFASA